MTTPNRRPRHNPSSSAGPSRSFLRQLLDEIRSDASQDNTASSVSGSLKSVPQDEAELHATIEIESSLGGAHDGTASDAAPRQRPTLRSLQIPSSRFIIQPAAIGEDIVRANSPLMFCDSDISFTPSPTEPPTSALTESSTGTTPPTSALTASSTDTATAPSPPDPWIRDPRKRGCSSDNTEPRLLSKKMRTMTLPETRSHSSIPNDGPHEPFSIQSFAGDNRRVIRDTAFIERAPAPLHTTKYRDQQLPELSSFRPDIASPEEPAPAIATTARSTTPVRTTTRRFSSATPEPPETPSFMRPLHLMDTSDELRHDISIYKNAQGEEWKRNSLCRHCFQRRGTFNRIMTYGYEACGRDDRLDSHYWEPTVCPHY